MYLSIFGVFNMKQSLECLLIQLIDIHEFTIFILEPYARFSAYIRRFYMNITYGKQTNIVLAT